MLFVFCFKQKTAYEMRISDWSSDVCSSDLEETGNTVISSDLYDRGFGEIGHDFLRTDRSAPNIITNPPFHSAEGFVASVLKQADKKFALLLRLEIGRASCRERVCQYV